MSSSGAPGDSQGMNVRFIVAWHVALDELHEDFYSLVMSHAVVSCLDLCRAVIFCLVTLHTMYPVLSWTWLVAEFIWIVVYIGTIGP